MACKGSGVRVPSAPLIEGHLSQNNLDRVGIRRLMFYIEKQIRRMFRNRKRRCNTHDELMNLLKRCTLAVLQDVKDRKGLFEYKYEIDFPTLKASVFPREESDPIILSLKLTNIYP